MITRASTLKQNARLRVLNEALEQVNGIMNDAEGRIVGLESVKLLLG